MTSVTIHSLATFTQQLKDKACQLGFELTGVAPAAAPGRLDALHRWLDAGYAGQMDYIEKRRAAYAHPRFVLEGCRSVVMLALPYGDYSPDLSAEANEPAVNHGRVARYASDQRDYHDVIHERLKQLRGFVLERYPQAAVRGVVDTAPLLERELAEVAGLGWVGKNTLLLNRQWGSYFFLAALLTDLELASDEPYDKGYCGTCTACLEACPTQAFPEPFVLDARRCISYLTIEHRSVIAEELQGQLHGWIFGCDICQEVCPWNRKAQRELNSAMNPATALSSLNLLDSLQLTEESFRQRFRHTPLWRSKRRGLIRNALLLVGSRRLLAAIPSIERLLHDTEPLIRSAAVWAVAHMDHRESLQQLRSLQLTESDPDVLRAIEHALAHLDLD
jgi:epoxyqueuosine reductase